MKKVLPLLVFIILIISSCKKEDPTPKPIVTTPQTNYYYLDSSISPYKFKVGSYWVYQNDSTNVLDSIVVDTITTGFVTTVPAVHGTTSETDNEFYKMNIHDVGNSKYYNETLMNKSLIRNFGGDYFHFDGQHIYLTNSAIGTTYHGMTIIAKFLTININTNNFNNIDEVKITAADQYQPEFANDTYLYYTNSVGLIKKETMLSATNIESWSLKRWNVIR